MESCISWEGVPIKGKFTREINPGGLRKPRGNFRERASGQMHPLLEEADAQEVPGLWGRGDWGDWAAGAVFY